MVIGVDPQIQALLDRAAQAGVPKIHQLSVRQARAFFAETTQKMRSLVPPIPVRTITTDSTGTGYGHVPVRFYSDGPDVTAPAILYFHGGGHVLGGFASHDLVARSLATRTGFVVISVDYRMGPEHPYPAAVEDSFDAVRWVLDHAEVLNIDPARIAVCGDSAGGNLATVCAIMARDAGLTLAAQALVYPVIDYRGGTASGKTYATGYGGLEAETVAWFMSHYLPDPERRDDWQACPANADLTGLPPTFMVLAECDVLVDEGRAYAQQMRDAGVAVEETTYPGMIHAFFNYIGLIDQTARAHDDLAAFLKRVMRD